MDGILEIRSTIETSYIKENLIDLISRRSNEELSKLYRACDSYGKNGRMGRLRHYPFFIYWLLAKLNSLWTRNNFKNSLRGAAVLKENWYIEATDFLYKLSEEDSRLSSYFENKDLSYAYMSKVFHRYRRRALLERIILENAQIESWSDIIKSLGLSNYSERMQSDNISLSNSMKNYLDLKDDVLDYIKREGVVILSEMRHNIRRFRKINKDLFEKILFELEEYEGRISRKPFSGRTYINYRG